MAKKVQLLPSASRMVGSLRDIGYTLPTSIADLVDNSIEAGATEICIDFAFKGKDSYIRISDNGIGISPHQMEEVLRYGTNRDYSANDLGKFGLGLKTASLSQCRKLTLASRQRGSNEISIMMWDLNHIEAENVWEAFSLEIDEANSVVTEKLINGWGTVVLWEELDRVAEGNLNKENYLSVCRLIEEHLSMVFHRFLMQEAKRRLPLTIKINGNPIEAWDPFARSEPHTRALTTSVLNYEHKGKQIKVQVKPYILPPEGLFSSKAAHAKAAGPKKWNRQQGFYIYRNDRLIQSGGWNRIRAADEHTKLARIAIDFSSEADDSFKINIAKMSVQLPSQIRSELEKLTASVASAANKIYRERNSTATLAKSKSSTKKITHSAFSSISSNDSTLTTESPTKYNSEASSVNPVESNIVREEEPVFEKPSNVFSPHQNEPTSSIVNTVLKVLKRELVDYPELLRRILVSLAEERPEFR